MNITVRGKTNYGEKRSVWPILTMQIKVRIMWANFDIIDKQVNFAHQLAEGRKEQNTCGDM